MKIPTFSTRPLYLQVSDALTEKIVVGQWKPGSVIPSEIDIAQEYSVSPGTVRKALGEMVLVHLLTRSQGRGTFVNDQGSRELAVRFTNIRNSEGVRLAPTAKMLSLTRESASAKECERLQLEPAAAVYRLRRVRYHNERAYMVDETSMPADLFPDLESLEDISPRISVLAQQHGIMLRNAKERVSIAAASPEAAKVLGVGNGAPLMLLDRLVFALDGRPVEWRVGHCHFADEIYVAEM